MVSLLVVHVVVVLAIPDYRYRINKSLLEYTLLKEYNVLKCVINCGCVHLRYKSIVIQDGDGKAQIGGIRARC